MSLLKTSMSSFGDMRKESILGKEQKYKCPEVGVCLAFGKG
jgi:hypothetical protein